MTVIEDTDRRCDECGKRGEKRLIFIHATFICAHCIRVAGIILARAEKDAAKDDVPAPEGERR